MGHGHVQFEPNNEYYKFGGWMKTMSIVFIALGLIGSIWAFYDNGGMNHHSRFWSNLLLNAYYFNGMAITAIFFVSAHSIGYGGWFVALKRVFESFGAYILVSFAIFSLIILGIWFDWHNLYEHWLKAPVTDTIVGDKKAFLNKYMFTGLSLLFFIGWIVITKMIRKHSLASDHAVDEYAYNQKSKYLGSAYIVLFGVSTSVFSWMALMSLDPHWYSTMFGWYNFGSYMCGFLCMSLLIITYLKSQGLLTFVNDSHIHNICLFLFGFSVFWTYTMYDQFMLQWYANIPEDTMWFVKRFNIPLFKAIFWVCLILNFALPFLFLIRRNAKRNPWIFAIVASIILFGHYLDFYFMTMLEPNAPSHHVAEAKDAHHSNAVKVEVKNIAQAHISTDTLLSTQPIEAALDAPVSSEGHSEVASTTEHHEATNTHEGSKSASHDEYASSPTHYATIGLIEIMMFLGFVGLFLFSVLTSLSKDRLVPIKSPFLDESLNYKF